MPALESIEVEGYKSIRMAKVDLGPVNVLIGANGAGKSNLLGVFGLLADLADQRLQLHIGRQGGADAILHFGRKKTSSLRICLRFGAPAYEAVLVPSAGDTLVFQDEVAWSGHPYRSPIRASYLDEDAVRGTGESLGPGGHKETGLGSIGEHQGHSAIVQPVAAAMKNWRRV